MARRPAPPHVAARGRRAIAAAALERSGLGALLRLAPAWRGLVVLNYHRIGTPGDSPLDRAMWNATLEDFDAQVGFLARNFDVVGAGRRHRAPPRRARSSSPSTTATATTTPRRCRSSRPTARPRRSSSRPASSTAAPGVVGRGRVDGPARARATRSASTARASRSTTRTARRAVATLLDRAKALPGAELAGFLDRVALATGTGRAPALVSDGQWMTWRMARELLAAGMHDRRPHRRPPDPRASRPRRPARGDPRLRGPAARRARDPDALVQLPNGDQDSFDAHTRGLLEEAGVELAFSFDGGFLRRGARGTPTTCRASASGRGPRATRSPRP